MTDVLRDIGPGGPEMDPETIAQVAQEQPTPSALAAEGFSSPVDLLPPHYQPVAGSLNFVRTKPLEGCRVDIFDYRSFRASRKVGVYVPEGFKPEDNDVAVAIHTPLGTGVKGHNQEIGRQAAEKDFLAVVAGPPRYNRFTTRAVTLGEDANEMFGILNAINSFGKYGNFEQIIGYGESQGAMKLLGELSLKDAYGYEMVDALAVAACYLRQIHWARPDKQLRRLAGMGLGAIKVARTIERERLETFRGTFSIKDSHHHGIVLPVLMSGETGTFLDHIPEKEDFTALMFGNDGYSKPRRVQAELQSRFPNVDAIVLDGYGHVDGILSPKTRMYRELMLFEVAKQLDLKGAVGLEQVTESATN